MGYIYQIKNKINGKSYIGQTSQEDVKIRWNSHIRAIRSNTGCPLLQIAVQKYGLDNFEIKLIIICFDKDLNKYEKEYIKRYNTFGEGGYNASAGGEPGGTFAGHTHTKENCELFSRINLEYGSRPEVRQHRRELIIKRFSDPEERKRHGERMRQSYQERKEAGTQYVRTKEHSEKISQALKDRYIDTNVSPIDWTDEKRKQHSEKMTRINGRKINQYDLTGNLIASYPSIIAAANALNHNRKAINANLRNRTKSSGGFIWKYVT